MLELWFISIYYFSLELIIINFYYSEWDFKYKVNLVVNKGLEYLGILILLNL